MNNVHPMYVLLFSVGASILIYFFILEIILKKDSSDSDVLNKKIVNAPFLGKNCCSTWPISHVVLYAICAYIWPHKWKELFVMGLIWEFIEWVAGILQSNSIRPTTFNSPSEHDDSIEYKQWWSFKYSDILFNLIGIIIGLCLKGKLL